LSTTDYLPPLHAFVNESLLEGQGGDLAPDASLVELGIIDSFSLVELTIFCEERFGIRIPDGELTPQNVDSIETIAALLEHLAGRHEVAAGAPREP
jgi:acyl carrier protein